MSSQPSFKEKFKYAVDNMFSKGPAMMILWLAIFSLFIVVIAALVVVLLNISPDGGDKLGFIEAVWLSMMRTLDPGTMGGDAGWGFRLVMFAVTIGGIFVISTLIGVLTSGIETKMDDLRQGHSKVIESNHTIILGWSEQIFTIIPELVAANENLNKSCIVIMGEKDKVEMETEIADKVGSTGKTRIVCRRGSPVEMSSLDILNLNGSKSIIVLSPEGDDPDAEVIKTCLAITRFPNRRSQPFHVVAELRNPKNLDVAKVVGKDEVEWLKTGDIVSRVIAQTCRQSGLSLVYTDLLDFGGDEIYFYMDASLIGKTFGEVLNRFNENAIMGLWEKGGVPALNPPMDTILQDGDQLFLLAADDDKIALLPQAAAEGMQSAIVDGAVPMSPPEDTLVLGWNWRAASILHELDNYVPPKSRLVVMADKQYVENDSNWGKVKFKNLQGKFIHGDTTDRDTLDEMKLSQYEHIILLCYSDALDNQAADSKTLITLLHLRDIAGKDFECNYTVVSEMLDIRNRNLAEVTQADDFIVSDKLISLMFAQVAESKNLNAVFEDVFDPEGSEIYLKPATHYIKPGEKVTYATVVESARRKGELALGYRIVGYAKDDENHGIYLNPAKTTLVEFGENDKIIVVAE